MADSLEEMGTAFSTSIMDNIDKAQRAITELLDDPAWKEADFFGKIEIAWNRLVGEPLSRWWNTEGKQQISELAEDVGDFIGTGLNRGIMAFFGVADSGILQDGMSAGSSFMEGFLKGLEPGKVKEAIRGGIGSLLSDSVFGGGNSSTSWLSTLLVGSMGLKGLGTGIKLGKGVYDTYSAVKILGGLF